MWETQAYKLNLYLPSQTSYGSGNGYGKGPQEEFGLKKKKKGKKSIFLNKMIKYLLYTEKKLPKY